MVEVEHLAKEMVAALDKTLAVAVAEKVAVLVMQVILTEEQAVLV